MTQRYTNHFNRCVVKFICFKLTLLNLTQGVYQTYGSLRNCSPPPTPSSRKWDQTHQEQYHVQTETLPARL